MEMMERQAIGEVRPSRWRRWWGDRHRHRAAVISLWIGVLIATGIAHAQPSGRGPELVAIPRPELESLQPTVRAKIETLRGDLQRLLEEGSSNLPQLIEGFGLLGQLFHAFGLLDAAQACYENAGRLAAGQDPRWPYYQGLIHHSQGRLEQAVASYGRVLELQPEQLSTLLRLGNVLFELGREEEAVKSFAEVERIAPDTAAALYGLGRAAARSGDHERAVDYFEQVLALQPEASSVHYVLAQSLLRIGDEEGAASHLERRGDGEVRFRDDLGAKIAVIEKSMALEVVADLAAADDFNERDFLGFVLAQLAGSPGAAEQLERVIESLANGADENRVQAGRIRYAAGSLYAAEARDEDAVAALRTAIELAPSLIDARLKLGNALARLGRYAEAVTAYGGLLERRAEDPAALGQRAAARSNLGRFSEARSDLERVVALEPGNRQARLDLAGVLVRLEIPEAAVEQLESAIDLSTTPSERAAAHVQLARLFRGQGDAQRSGEQYERALLADAGHLPALRGLATLLAQLGRMPQAAHVYGRLLRLEPTDAAARMGEATALILSGEHALARDRLEEGVVLLPESLDLKDLLARHLAASPERSVRDGARAVELAEELYRAVPTLESLETLAMAHAEAGGFEQAIEWQRRLLEAASEAAPEQRERWRQNLALYEQRQSCCVGSGEEGR